MGTRVPIDSFYQGRAVFEGGSAVSGRNAREGVYTLRVY